MHQYELMVILDPTVEERTVAPSLDKFLNVIRNGGGTVDKVDIWGRRRLSYEINKKTEGIYAVVNLKSTSALVVELDRQLRLSEAVMRTKVLRADEAVVNINPVEVPEVSPAEKAAEVAEEKPAKAAPKAAEVAEVVEEKPAKAAPKSASKAPAAAKAPAKAPAKKPAAKKAE
jgi:small subunit ribosomal protein S6